MYTITQGLRLWIGVRIAVVGPPKLENPEQFSAGLRLVLAHLDKLLAHTPHAFIAVSTLAEDVDRIVARHILDWPSPKDPNHGLLEIILPSPRDEFGKNLATQEAKDEFQALCERAYNTRILDKRPLPPIGQLLVRTCDVLICASESEKDVLADYARDDVGRTMVIIDSTTGKTRWHENDDATVESLVHLNGYNGETIDAKEVRRKAKKSYDELSALAYSSGIPQGTLEPLHAGVLTHMVRAGMLAERWQRWHVAAGKAIYILAAAAVATLTIGHLFFPVQRMWVWGEFFEIGLILLTLTLSWRGEWLRKWIDYRFLAERLRATIYLFVAGLECAPPGTREVWNVAHWPTAWMATAYASICSVPIPKLREDGLAAAKKFVLKGWIVDQKDYYESRGGVLHFWQTLLEGVGLILFAVTFIAAFIDAGNLVAEKHNDAVVAIAIILPAFGASVAGFRAYREYRRNSMEYESMAKYLSRMKSEIQQTAKVEDFQRLLEEANQVMLQEHQGWRVIVSVHEPKEAI
jgi:SMODS and SLOG-associating 2TM effector domain 1